MTTSDLPILTFEDDIADDKPTGWNFLLYGPPGQGKTVGACSAPGPVLVLNAEGPGGLRFARRKFGKQHLRPVRFVDQQTLGEVLAYLRGETDVQSVVIDSLGEIYAKLLRLLGGAKPQIQHYGQVNTLLEDFIRSLRDLPLHVVLVAHEAVEDSDEGGALRRPATGGRQLPEKSMAMMDVVAYCGVKQDAEEEGGELHYLGQVVQARGRRAKDRSGSLGSSRELDLSEWVRVMDAAMAPDNSDLPFDPEQKVAPTAEPGVLEVGGQITAEGARVLAEEEAQAKKDAA